jgi:hypothetical protein
MKSNDENPNDEGISECRLAPKALLTPALGQRPRIREIGKKRQR